MQLIKKYSLFLIICLFQISFCFSQPVQEWVRSYDGPDNLGLGVNAMAMDSSGNIILTGYTNMASSRQDYCTVMYNSNGIQQWVTIYDGIITSNGINWPNGICVDPQGNIFVTGYSERAGFESDDYCTIKYNSSGVQQWVSRYNSGSGSINDANAIAIDNLVTGQSTNASGVFNIVTIKYNSNGDSLWVKRYTSPYNMDDAGVSITTDYSGNVYVVGKVNFQFNSHNIITIKYNSSGVQQWANIGVQGYPCKIRLDNNNNVIIGGYEQISNLIDYVVIKYNNNGIQQWKQNYNFLGGYDYANDLIIDYQNNIYVTGRSYGGASDADYTTIKYNLQGVQQWVQRFNGPGNYFDESNSIFLDDSSNVYVTGFTSTPPPNGTSQFTTIKYNSSGDQQWLMNYPGGGYSIIVDKSQNVYVSGSNNNDNVTIKYTQLVGINPISSKIPDDFNLYSNYPNPFNPSTKIKFSIPEKSYTQLKIFNSLGDEIKTLLNEELKPGVYELYFIDNKLSSGVYFYKLTAVSYKNNFVKTMKMILLK